MENFRPTKHRVREASRLIMCMPPLWAQPPRLRDKFISVKKKNHSVCAPPGYSCVYASMGPTTTCAQNQDWESETSSHRVPVA